MATKKKRSKKYRGPSAKQNAAHIVRVEAADRSRLGQWWFEHKRFARPAIIAVVVVLLLGWGIVELIGLIF